MSLIPHFFERVDDLSNQMWRSFDPCFGLQMHPGQIRRSMGPSAFSHFFPTGYRRNWEIFPDSSNIISSDNEFKVSMDVQQFKPGEITVKVVENCIVVEGKHEDRQDEHGYISRQFVRKYSLPSGCDGKDIVSTLSSDGVLTVKADLPKTEKSERIIEIQQTGPTKPEIKGEEK